MDTVALTVQARATDTSAKNLRRESVVPCVVYGNDTDNVPLQCDHNEIYRAYVKAGQSTIVDLDIGSKKLPVLFHSIDFHPVSEKILHVDFYAVDMKKEIEAVVPVHFEGDAPAVKDLGGVLVTALDHVTVRCLPADLPHDLTVDLSPLEEYGHSLSVGDIPVPDKVTITNDPAAMLCTVQEPRRVEEEVVETAEGEEGEEGAEGAEGEGEGGEEKAEGESES